MKPIAEINEAAFEVEVLNAAEIVVVNFYAPWSYHSKAFAPVLEDVAASFGQLAKFVKVDADKNAGLGNWYDIRSLPTLLFFRNGQIVTKIIGATSKESILAKFESLVLSPVQL